MTSGSDNLSVGLMEALRGLAAAPSPGLNDRLFASWIRVSGPVGDVFVAFGQVGVSFLRTAASVHDDEDEFRELFRATFGRPLRPAARPPAGLMPVLRGRSGTRAVRLELSSAAPFELDVLKATTQIPRGQTRPYGWIAREIGRPGAARAVGSALRRNPVPLLVPCHRVARADGSVGDYVFGPEVKEQLLRGEGVNLDEVRGLARSDVFFVGSGTTRIVCFPTCANARRITPPHRRGFRTVRAAEQAGYRPCKQCRPAAVAA